MLLQQLEFQSCRLEIVPRHILGQDNAGDNKKVCLPLPEDFYGRYAKFGFQIAVLALLSVFGWGWVAVHRSANLRAACALIFPFQCKRSSSSVAISTPRHSSRILVKAGSDKQRCTLNRLGISSGGRQKLIRRGEGRRERVEHTKFRFPFLPVEMTAAAASGE